MRKALMTIVAAASMAAATMTNPTQAEARCWGCWAGGGVVGVALVAPYGIRRGPYGYGGYGFDGRYGYYGRYGGYYAYAGPLIWGYAPPPQYFGYVPAYYHYAPGSYAARPYARYGGYRGYYGAPIVK